MVYSNTMLDDSSGGLVLLQNAIVAPGDVNKILCYYYREYIIQKHRNLVTFESAKEIQKYTNKVQLFVLLSN